MRLTIDLDAAAAAFYTRVAESARLPLETVVADALFKLAGELSLEALRKPWPPSRSRVSRFGNGAFFPPFEAVFRGFCSLAGYGRDCFFHGRML